MSLCLRLGIRIFSDKRIQNLTPQHFVQILGGASGIGRAVCQALAREGASVVVTDLNDQGTQDTVDSLSKHVDSRHSNYSLDVTSGDEIRKVLEYIINGYRRPPCILVNSAGITRDDFLLTMDEEKFDKVIQVNLKVHTYYHKHHLKKKSFGLLLRGVKL